MDPPKFSTGWFHQVFSFSGLMIVCNCATKRPNSLILTRLIRSGSHPESHPLIERRDTLSALASISKFIPASFAKTGSCSAICSETAGFI